MDTTQQTKTKQIQVWGIKTHLTRLQTKMQRILQTRMRLTHLTATVMMRATDTNQSWWSAWFAGILWILLATGGMPQGMSLFALPEIESDNDCETAWDIWKYFLLSLTYGNDWQCSVIKVIWKKNFFKQKGPNCGRIYRNGGRAFNGSHFFLCVVFPFGAATVWPRG